VGGQGSSGWMAGRCCTCRTSAYPPRQAAPAHSPAHPTPTPARAATAAAVYPRTGRAVCPPRIDPLSGVLRVGRGRGLYRGSSRAVIPSADPLCRSPAPCAAAACRVQQVYQLGHDLCCAALSCGGSLSRRATLTRPAQELYLGNSAGGHVRWGGWRAGGAGARIQPDGGALAAEFGGEAVTDRRRPRRRRGALRRPRAGGGDGWWGWGDTLCSTRKHCTRARAGPHKTIAHTPTHARAARR
jgi:hypothetical protein